MSHDRLISALQNPAVWPDEPEAVDLCETHISWVFLTRDFAWKIKKPVRFEFLDFSTLERRRHFCREELRLNGRVAPELYLDVVPITGSADAPQVGGDGPPLEYAVKMRRFDQSQLFSRLAKTGTLTAELVDELGDAVAAFHAHAAAADATSADAGVSGLRKAAFDNIQALSNCPNHEELGIEQLGRWTEREFNRLRPELLQRHRTGMVRECHGDLHLNNIVRYAGRVCAFDGIEFNDELRWIDVLNDVAFTVMDFEEHGLAGLGMRFLNRYLERTGDYEGLGVLPFFVVYRALVRAKIDALRLNDATLASAARRVLSQELHEYLGIADQEAHHARPALLIMHGVSGSGKTVVSQQLLQELAAIRIRSDVERKRIMNLVPQERPDSRLADELYSADMTRRTYDRLADLARRGLAAGYTVIVDATFLSRNTREQFRALASDCRVRCIIAYCTAPESVLRVRLADRRRTGKDASDADENVLSQQLQAVEALDPSERQSAIVVDTNQHNWRAECLRQLQGFNLKIGMAGSHRQ